MSGWTEERVELAKALWAQGFSASQIAKQLGGGVSRSAIIGKIHRLKLPRSEQRIKATQQLARLRPQGRPAPPKRSKLIIVGNGGVVEKPPGHLPRYAVPEDKFSALPGCEPVAPMDLRAHGQCRWPIGDPALPDFGFCGCPAEATYCPAHAQIAYQPQTEKKKSANELARALRRYL